MLSEFQDLSDKIDRLAAMAATLRRENAALRQSNVLLDAENTVCRQRLGEAQRRVEALLDKLPALAAPPIEDEAA